MKRDKYPFEFKCEIVAFSLSGIKNGALSTYYNIDTHLIQYWCKYEKYKNLLQDITSKRELAQILYNEGSNIEHISTILNIKMEIVFYWINGYYLNVLPWSIGGYPEKFKDIICKEYLSGLSTIKIGEKYNINSGSIYNIVKERNIVRKRKIFTSEDDERIIELYKSGASCDEIVSVMNIDMSSIYNVLKRKNLQHLKRRQFERRTYTENDKELVIKLYIDDVQTVDNIVEKTGFSGFVINKWLKEGGYLRTRAEALKIYRSGNYKDGRSYEPYCSLFNKDLKERVISFWKYKCFLCKKTENKLLYRLSVHHVMENKQTCCDDSETYFVPLCRKCHGKTMHGKVGKEYNEKILNLIHKRSKNGKTFYSKEEYFNRFNKPPSKVYNEISVALGKKKKEKLIS